MRVFKGNGRRPARLCEGKANSPGWLFVALVVVIGFLMMRAAFTRRPKAQARRISAVNHIAGLTLTSPVINIRPSRSTAE